MNTVDENKETNSLFTNNINLTISSLIDKNKEIVIQPIFQRNYVWDNNKASKLIETILLSLPIPPIYLYRKEEKLIVIDGQQRLTAINKFINNTFCLNGLLPFKQFNGLYFKELPIKYQYTILNYIINLVTIENVDDENIIFDIFERFNKGGVYLNAQEIRNCIYNGKYTELIRELAQYKPFYELFDSSKIDRMEKEEYVLRFLALYEDIENYNGNMSSFLDNYLMKKNSIKDDEYTNRNIKHLKKIFKDSIDSCQAIFGKDAFKNCLVYKTNKTQTNIMYKLMSKPVFDLQMLGVTDMDFALINRFAEQLKTKYEDAISNDENLRPYYKRMSKKALSYRISKWREYVTEIINQ